MVRGPSAGRLVVLTWVVAGWGPCVGLQAYAKLPWWWRGEPWAAKMKAALWYAVTNPLRDVVGARIVNGSWSFEVPGVQGVGRLKGGQMRAT